MALGQESDRGRAWRTHLGLELCHEREQEYRHYRAQLQVVRPALDDRIRRGLNLVAKSTSDRRGLDESQLVELRHPRYLHVGNREQLRRLLSSFACKHPRVGYSKDLALLASYILPEMSSESSAFAVLDLLFERLKLEHIHLPVSAKPSELAQQHLEDAGLVLQTFRDLCSQTARKVVLQKCGAQLFELVQLWISTLFTVGFDPTQQSFEMFGSLLDRVVMVEADQVDPRKHVRYVALCVLMSLANKIEEHANKGDLVHFLDHLSRNLLVDTSMLSLIDEQLSAERCILFHRVCWMPFGAMTGWFSGLLLGSLAVTPVLAAPMGLAGLCLGLVTTFRLAGQDGFESLEDAAKLLLLLRSEGTHQEKQLEKQYEDGGTGHHWSEQPVQRQSRQSYPNSVSQSSQDVFEPDLDFFLGEHDVRIVSSSNRFQFRIKRRGNF